MNELLLQLASCQQRLKNIGSDPQMTSLQTKICQLKRLREGQREKIKYCTWKIQQKQAWLAFRVRASQDPQENDQLEQTISQLKIRLQHALQQAGYPKFKLKEDQEKIWEHEAPLVELQANYEPAINKLEKELSSLIQKFNQLSADIEQNENEIKKIKLDLREEIRTIEEKMRGKTKSEPRPPLDLASVSESLPSRPITSRQRRKQKNQSTISEAQATHKITSATWTILLSTTKWTEAKKLPRKRSKCRKLLSLMLPTELSTESVLSRLGQIVQVPPSQRPQHLDHLNNQWWQDCWKARIGNFRLIMQFDDDGKVLTVLIKHRRDAYEDQKK